MVVQVVAIVNLGWFGMGSVLKVLWFEDGMCEAEVEVWLENAL